MQSMKNGTLQESPAFLYNRKFYFLLYKKPLAGCALRRTMMMSQATAAGARMCQGTFFALITKTFRQEKKSEKVYAQTSADLHIYLIGDFADNVYIDAVNARFPVQR